MPVSSFFQDELAFFAAHEAAYVAAMGPDDHGGEEHAEGQELPVSEHDVEDCEGHGHGHGAERYIAGEEKHREEAGHGAEQGQEGQRDERADGGGHAFSAFEAEESNWKELAEKLSSAIGGTYLLRGEPDRICRKAAVVSGGGGVDSVIEAARIGCDLLITGEMEHIMHHTAIENNVAVIALGHYASETTGPKALMKLIARTFNIPTIFADCPTGL